MVATSSKRTLDPKEEHLPADKTSTNSSNTIISELATQEKSSSSGTTLKLIALNIKSISDEDVGYIQNVERLSLRKNHLTSLPASFKRLSRLQYLDLHNNNFKEIPYILTQCPQLEILDLSSNEIEALPDEISSFWQDNIRVLSLKDNNVTSIRNLKSITKLNKLSILDLEDNKIPKEELDQVQSYTPFHTGIPKEEYWAIAISRYLKDHPNLPTPEPKISRAAKRMGFINTNLSNGAMNENNIISLAPSANTTISASTAMVSSNQTSATSFSGTVNAESEQSGAVNGTELYNHTKYNDYFKRLSILPEESMSNGHQKISHAELVVSCRKLLFSFTECQQAIRKIASFCKEKAVAVNVVSLLYSVRSHTDNLVEVLQQTENEDESHDQALIKLCLTIITNFKQIITLLRKNFEIFFKEDDLCFIRMFYMTLMCAYMEMYNAWSFIKEDDQVSGSASKAPKKHSFSRHETSSSSITSGGGPAASTTSTHCSGNIKLLPKTRSTRTPSASALLSNSNILTGDTTAVPLLSPNLNGAHTHGPILGHQNAINNGSSQTNMNEVKTTSDTIPRQQLLQHNKSISDSKKESQAHEPKQHPVMTSSIINASNSNNVSNVNITPPPMNGGGAANSSANVVETNIDIQLYQTLSTVVKMVSVVYNQLTSEISKIAIASTMGKQILTDSLAPKIRDLTETCRQAMDLSKQLNERLDVLIPNDSNSEKYLTSLEKLKTWEIMNSFLKVIISILANTKIVMSDVPNLNELRPNLANLAKITKDVTVILDLSSYKAVSVSANSPE